MLTVILEMIRQGGIDVKPQLEFACYYLEIITSSGLLNEAVIFLHSSFQLTVLSWSGRLTFWLVRTYGIGFSSFRWGQVRLK